MIEHEGIIKKIDGNHITVLITQQSACTACHAKGVCMAADAKEKLVEVYDSSGQFHENDRVMVTGKRSMGYKALLWAFVVPLIILIAIIILTTSVWHTGEIMAAVISLAALIPYGAGLYLFRNELKKTFSFIIEKPNN